MTVSTSAHGEGTSVRCDLDFGVVLLPPGNDEGGGTVAESAATKTTKQVLALFEEILTDAETRR